MSSVVETESPKLAPSFTTTGKPTDGQLLSAMEVAVADFKNRLERERTSGPKRSSDHVSGFRFGWRAAVAFMEMRGVGPR